jgi:UbiD family decarboxylase
MTENLREFLARLEMQDQLIRIRKEVDPRSRWPR